MHLTRFSFAALAIALLAGCGSGTTESAEQPDDDPPSAMPREFTGIHAENYRTAYFICGEFPIRKVASDLGIDSTDPVTVAKAYADEYKPEYRQAPFEGCLDAFIGDPPKIAPN
jgi:hypothetical protein